MRQLGPGAAVAALSARAADAPPLPSSESEGTGVVNSPPPRQAHHEWQGSRVRQTEYVPGRA